MMNFILFYLPGFEMAHELTGPGSRAGGGGVQKVNSTGKSSYFISDY